MTTQQPFPVTVHPYPRGRHGTAYAYELGPALDSPAANALVFIGGLGDGPHTVGYVRAVGSKLEAARARLGYTVFEAKLSSSFTGFGTSSLARDVKELSGLVSYLRGLGKKKIVFMGHSTGCQDCMEYNNPKHGAPPVDGFILQGPVSDREAITSDGDCSPEQLSESLSYAEGLVKSGKGAEVMPGDKMPPTFFKSPVSAYRWHSLASAGGDDDYFSSDLPDEKLAEIWGRVQSPLLIVPSGNDQYVPEAVDCSKLVEKWKSFCRPGAVSDLSGLIPGANHEVEQPESREWLGSTVVKFLEGLDGMQVRASM